MADEILTVLRESSRILLTTHLSPDGDALGSQIAFGRFLEKRGHQVDMINADEAPRNLEWMPGVDDVDIFDGSLDQHEAIAEADAIFVLDTNGADRLGKLGSMVQQSAATKVLIDHHQRPEQWFDVYYLRTSAAATGELIYEIIDAVDLSLIDSPIATALYTAIMTDTGSFRYSNVSPDVHRIIADILERGAIQPAPIHERIYDRKSMAGLRLLGRMLNRIRLRYDGQVGYSVVTQRMVRETNASWDEKEGFVNYVLSIEGVKAALLFSEVSDGAKISFRSEADVAVDAWARHFGGGGHQNASGAYVKKPFEEAIEAVLDAAPRFLDLQDDVPGDGLTEEDASYLETLLKMKEEES